MSKSDTLCPKTGSLPEERATRQTILARNKVSFLPPITKIIFFLEMLEINQK